MNNKKSFTSGGVLSSLIKFAIPVLVAMFLQSLYGAVDLLVVEQFAETIDVSGVATGSLLLQTVTMIITGLSMGVTIYVGQKTGEKNEEEAGKAIGAGIVLFILIGVILSILLVVFTKQLANMLHAPSEAYVQTCEYIIVCGSGTLFIGLYNLLGAIFRGIGDSKTPLFTVGVAEKVCAFIMLVPSAFSQAMSAFVAQNIGAGYKDRALKALKCGIITSLTVAVFIGSFTFFEGDVLANIFTKDAEVIEEAFQYLRAYAIDTFLTAILFCFIGYYNGCGKTLFVMIQGIVGAFCVRVPIVLLMSNLSNTTLFHIGLATPISSIVQVALCISFMLCTAYVEKKKSSAGESQRLCKPLN